MKSADHSAFFFATVIQSSKNTSSINSVYLCRRTHTQKKVKCIILTKESEKTERTVQVIKRGRPLYY